MTLQSLRVMNTMVSNPQKPIPPDDELDDDAIGLSFYVCGGHPVILRTKAREISFVKLATALGATTPPLLT